jgi:hypothetical protein
MSALKDSKIFQALQQKESLYNTLQQHHIVSICMTIKKFTTILIRKKYSEIIIMLLIIIIVEFANKIIGNVKYFSPVIKNLIQYHLTFTNKHQKLLHIHTGYVNELKSTPFFISNSH